METARVMRLEARHIDPERLKRAENSRTLEKVGRSITCACVKVIAKPRGFIG